MRYQRDLIFVWVYFCILAQINMHICSNIMVQLHRWLHYPNMITWFDGPHQWLDWYLHWPSDAPTSLLLPNISDAVQSCHLPGLSGANTSCDGPSGRPACASHKCIDQNGWQSHGPAVKTSRQWWMWTPERTSASSYQSKAQQETAVLLDVGFCAIRL